MPEVSGHTCDQIPICGTIYPHSETSSVIDEEIVVEGPEVSKDFPSLSSDHSVSHCSQMSHKCPTEVPSKTYSAVVKSSLPQSLDKSYATLQTIHHELPIENFEVGQCSQIHESSSSDDSSPRFHKISKGSRKPQLNNRDCGSPKSLSKKAFKEEIRSRGTNRQPFSKKQGACQISKVQKYRKICFLSLFFKKPFHQENIQKEMYSFNSHS